MSHFKNAWNAGKENAPLANSMWDTSELRWFYAMASKTKGTVFEKIIMPEILSSVGKNVSQSNVDDYDLLVNQKRCEVKSSCVSVQGRHMINHISYIHDFDFVLLALVKPKLEDCLYFIIPRSVMYSHTKAQQGGARAGDVGIDECLNIKGDESWLHTYGGCEEDFRRVINDFIK